MRDRTLDLGSPVDGDGDEGCPDTSQGGIDTNAWDMVREMNYMALRIEMAT